MSVVNADLKAWFYKQLYCRLIGTVLPLTWFGPKPPEPRELSQSIAKPTLEIVSHCWQYAHLLIFQLSSLVNYPPRNINVIYHLFYAEEDRDTVELIRRFAELSVPNVEWRFSALPRDALFRRAIGRNKAAIETTADWVWFADCDLIFHDGCMDSVAASLAGKQFRLAYPSTEQITELLPANHALVAGKPSVQGIVDIDAGMFFTNPITKAKGAFQIVHGDVARHCGYCKDLKFYQQPTKRWRKTFEDTAFRRLIDDEGLPVSILALHRIRHQQKGRYADSAISGVRGYLRQRQEQNT